MQSVTLTELRTSILDQADMTSSSFLNTDQLTYWINSSLAELHDLLVTSFEEYFVKLYEFDLEAGTESYLLPEDFYKNIKVFYKDGSDRYRVPRFMMDDIDSYLSRYHENRSFSYRIMGNLIWFLPSDYLSGSIELWYVPQFNKLVNGEDSVHISVPVMWEDFVVCDCAARALEKERRDPTPFLMRKQALAERIILSAEQRDTGEPGRIVDVYNRSIDRDLWE